MSTKTMRRQKPESAHRSKSRRARRDVSRHQHHTHGTRPDVVERCFQAMQPRNSAAQESPLLRPAEFQLPFSLVREGTGEKVFVFDEVEGRPTVTAYGPGGKPWLSFGPDLLTEKAQSDGHANVPALRLHCPTTGLPAVEVAVYTPEYGSGGRLILFRESGNEAAYIDAGNAGGHLVLLGGCEATVGQEAPFLELWHGEQGGQVILGAREGQYGSMRLDFD